MDGDRFDRLARMLGARGSRRSAVGLTAALALGGGLTAAGEAAGRASKAKKACGPCRRRVGETCRPKPNGTRCGDGRVCKAGRCVAVPPPPPAGCAAGQKPCGGACIPAGDCCADAECAGIVGATCRRGECRCPDGQRSCRGACIPANQCCADGDCAGSVAMRCCGGDCIPAWHCCDGVACPEGRMRLANGSCARPCPNDGCPSAVCGRCGWEDLDGTARYCTADLASFDCATIQRCDTTADCPCGFHCQIASCPHQRRCVALCQE